MLEKKAVVAAERRDSIAVTGRRRAIMARMSQERKGSRVSRRDASETGGKALTA